MSVCQYWNCSKKIKYGYFLCSEHYEALEDKLIDKCPQCGRYKDILKGNNAKYYVGQTRDLRARLSEHRDGKTRSTAGSNIQLQYFEEFKTRKEAELREVALKKLVQNDERQIRKMIINFQDRIKEVRF